MWADRHVGRSPTESKFSRAEFLLHGSSEKAQGIGVLNYIVPPYGRRSNLTILQ